MQFEISKEQFQTLCAESETFAALAYAEISRLRSAQYSLPIALGEMNLIGQSKISAIKKVVDMGKQDSYFRSAVRATMERGGLPIGSDPDRLTLAESKHFIEEFFSLQSRANAGSFITDCFVR